MTLQNLSFVFGALLLLIGIIGGGFEIKEIKIPKVPLPIRLIAFICGAVFIFFAFKYEQTPTNNRKGDVQNPVAQDVPTTPVTSKTNHNVSQAPTKKQLPKAPTPNVSGKWNSSIGLIYKLSQDGDSFLWVVTGVVNEKGHGKLDGNTIKVSWTGDLGSGSAIGRITMTDSAGRAVKIEWPGVTFTRMKE